jgi:hypothetical protein
MWWPNPDQNPGEQEVSWIGFAIVVLIALAIGIGILFIGYDLFGSPDSTPIPDPSLNETL